MTLERAILRFEHNSRLKKKSQQALFVGTEDDSPPENCWCLPDED